MAASLVAEAATAWLAEAGSLALARRALVLLLVELVLVAALVAARVTALALVSEPVAVAAWVAVGFSWLSAGYPLVGRPGPGWQPGQPLAKRSTGAGTKAGDDGQND